jgi:adenylate cyclase
VVVLTSINKTVLSVALLFALCTAWALLSQIPILRLPNVEKFLGPDGALAFLENITIDTRIRVRGPIEAPLKVLYVDVDTESISRLGNFPWNRDYFALALDALFKQGGIKAAGMDFVFSMAGIPALGRNEAEQGTRALGKVIHREKNIVLAGTYGTQNRPLGDVSSFPFIFESHYGTHPVGPPELPAFPIIGPSWGHVGLIDTVGDDVRYVPFFAKADLHTYYPMSLELALLHWGLDPSAIKISPNCLTISRPDGSIASRIPLILGQLAEPNWFNAWMDPAVGHFSIVDVMAYGKAATEGTDEQKALAKEFFEPFREGVVLIGPVDPLLKDLSVMPLSGPNPVPRVFVHGNLLQSIVAQRFLHRPPVWLNVGFIFLLGFAGAAFCLVPARFTTAAKAFSLTTALTYMGAAFLVFSKNDLLLPLVAPLGAALSCTFAGSLLQLSREQSQKRRIKGMFGAYLSPSLVDKMIESGEEPRLGGIDAEITAFFSDVQNFSSFSEQLTPQQLVSLMNEYLSAMTDILMEQGCYVDKYIGDAIVGIFNSPVPLPNHALQACVATQTLQKRLASLREKWAAEGEKWPPFVSRMQMRIGLNTGFATVGNMGSSRRFNYTMMGDTVNLAARCESGAKSYGVYTMITGETRRAAEQVGQGCVFRFLDRIIVKGRREPAEMHEIVCLAADLTPETSRCLALYASGIEHYLARQWDAAIAAFEQSAALEPNRPERNPESPTTPSSVMLARTRLIKQNPPGPEWDGVFKMQTK